MQVEHFIADFTGQAICFRCDSGNTITLKKRVPIVKDRGYALLIDKKTQIMRLIDVVPPPFDPWRLV